MEQSAFPVTIRSITASARLLPTPASWKAPSSKATSRWFIHLPWLRWIYWNNRPEPPHTEDQYFIPGSFRFVQEVKDHKKVLAWSLFNSVQDIFEQTILHKPGSHVKDGQGPRSVGTIHAKTIVGVHFDQGPEETWDYRLSFYDYSGTYYRIKITDLTFLYYLTSLRSENSQPKEIADHLTKALKKKDVYLRIGLSRGWAKFPDLCFLQVNGIYAIPDLYAGKKFTDYRNISAHGIAESNEEGYDA